MNVVGISGESIGTVERLEIDETGRLKTLIFRVAATLDTRKRLAAEQVRSIEGRTVNVAVSLADVASLADDCRPAPTRLWQEDGEENQAAS